MRPGSSPGAATKSSSVVSQLTRDWIAAMHSDARGGVWTSPANIKMEMIMFKTLVAALILATASVALTSKVNAGPTEYQNPTFAPGDYMDRASKIWDGGAQ